MSPPADAERSPAAPSAAEEEEDRISALIPTLPLVTSPPPSLLEIGVDVCCPTLQHACLQ